LREKIILLPNRFIETIDITLFDSNRLIEITAIVFGSDRQFVKAYSEDYRITKENCLAERK